MSYCMFRYNRAYGLECFIFQDIEISNTKIPPETWSDRLTSEIEPCNLKLTTNLHVFFCGRSVPLILVLRGVLRSPYYRRLVRRNARSG